MFLFDLVFEVYRWQWGTIGFYGASAEGLRICFFLGLLIASIVTAGASDSIYAFCKKRHYRYLTYLVSCIALFFTVMLFWPPIAALYILISVVLDGPRTVRNTFSRISKAISACYNFFGKVIRNPKLNGNEV